MSTPLPTQTFGKTGLEVTQLGFGAMELRGPKVWGGREISDEQAESILHAVLDAGINFVDTAGCYGLAEERIGKFISSRRGEYTLATKCGCNQVPNDQGTHDTPHTWNRDTLLRNIDESLSRTKTDHVDVWQIHNAKPESVKDGKLVEVLQEVKDKGLVQHIAISSTLPDLKEYISWGVFEAFQIPYSCLQMEHHEAITEAAESGAGIIIRGGIGKGGPESATGRKELNEVWEKARLAELVPAGLTKAQLILRYTLSHPHCHTTIVGTMNPAHLRENLDAAAAGPLAPDLYDEITRRVRQAGA